MFLLTVRRIVLFPWLVRLLANKKIVNIKFFIRITRAITYKLSERHKWHIPSGNISNAYVLHTLTVCLSWCMSSETIVQLECFICQSRWPLLLSVGVCDEQSVLFAITGGVTFLLSLLAKGSCPHIAHWQESSCLVLTCCVGVGVIFRFSLGAKCVRYDPQQ